MKKFISGLLVGMALMLTGSVFATEIQSMIGKTIQGQFGVTVDGKSLEMPAIVVDGTSFLPVRSFGESVGYAVYFDAEGAVRLEKQAQLLTVDATAKQAQWEKDRTANQQKVDDLRAKAKSEEDALDNTRQKATAEEAINQEKRKKIMEDDAKKQQEAQQQQTQPQPSATK